MASFTITPVEKGIMRCRHTAAFTHDDIRALASFFDDYRGKLLIDLTGRPARNAPGTCTISGR